MSKQENDSRACAPVKREKDILQHMIDGAKNIHLAYLDRDFNFVRVNHAYAHTCGYKPEEMIGKNHFALYPHEENEAIFKRVKDTGVPAQYHDKPFTYPDQPEKGITYWDWILEPVKDDSGKVIGLIFSLVETTERKRAEETIEESEDKFRSAFETSPDACYIGTLEDGTIIEVNDAFLRVWGYSQEECIGKTSLELGLYAKGPPDRQRMLTEIKSKGHFSNLEFNGKRKNGEVFPLLFSGTILKTKGKKLIYGILKDITVQKKAEEELVKHRRNLEKLVEERTKQLKDSERLAAIGATAGMVGHDIRNPLQAIVSDVYLLKDELSSIPEGDKKACLSESLDGIEKNISYINKIVADLQDYAKPITPIIKETELEQICQEILQKNIPTNIEATCKIDKTVKQVKADPELLKRVIANLVTNAVQAMPKGGKLTINAYREKSEVVIEVQDTGEGIPDEVKTKLFTPLFTTKSKGQGFGLAVVKRVTESMNGTVNFESEKGKGTKFILRLPQEPNGKWTYK